MFFLLQFHETDEAVKTLKRKLEAILPKKRFLLDLAPGGGLPTPQPSDSEGEDSEQNVSSKKVRFDEEVREFKSQKLNVKII